MEEEHAFPQDRLRAQIEMLDRIFGTVEPEVERIPPRPSNARHAASLPDGTEYWIGHNNNTFIFDPRTGLSTPVRTAHLTIINPESQQNIRIIDSAESSIIPTPPLVKFKNRNFFELITLTR